MNSYQISILVCILSFIGIFAFPTFIDGMNGGFALAFFCILISLTSFFCIFLFYGIERDKKAVIDGKNILAHWTYSKEQWEKYRIKEHEVNKEEKWSIFKIIAFFAVLFGILFPIFDFENGIIVSYVMIGLIVLIAVVAQISIMVPYYKNKKVKNPEIKISTNGVLFNDSFFCWRGFLTKLEGVSIQKRNKTIDFCCSTLGRCGKTYYECRVPIPEDKIEEAEEIIKKLER